jgi:hypothetical protein
MCDPGMDEFRENWEASGYQLPFSYKHTSDERVNGTLSQRLVGGASVFIREHVIELGLSVLGFSSNDPEGSIDVVGGTIGSLDTIYVTDSGNGQVQIIVENTMGWESGTRIPGTNNHLIPNRDRSEKKGLGGTTYQYFIWYEPSPENE